MNPTNSEQMIVLYWHCLDMAENDERFVAGALEQLCQYLRTEPTQLAITSKRLKDERERVKEIDKILYKICNQPDEFERGTWDIVKVLPTTVHLLVYCMPGSEIAEAAKTFNNEARWGICQPCCLTCNSFAALYQRGNPFVVWHEALHLLGADDCYDENDTDKRKSDCNLEKCIMQYIPTPENVGTWPFLCDKNVNRVQKKAEYLTRL